MGFSYAMTLLICSTSDLIGQYLIHGIQIDNPEVNPAFLQSFSPHWGLHLYVFSASFVGVHEVKLYLQLFKRWLSDVLGVVCSVILSQRASFHCIAHIPPFFTHTTLFSTWMPKILPPQRSLCRWRTHLTTFCVARWLGIYNVGWLSSTFHA